MRRFSSRALNLIVGLVALLLGGCGGPANTNAPVAADQPIVYTVNGAQGGGISAIRGRDGTTLWRATLGFQSGTAIVAGDVVFTCVYPVKGDFGEDVIALRLRDGKQLWRTSLVPPSQESSVCRFATDGTTLALVGGQRTPAPANGSSLYALNAANGAIRWRQAINAVGPVLLEHGMIYTTIDADPMETDSRIIGAFAASDGKPLWSVPYVGQYAGSEFVGDDRALYTDEHGQAIAALDQRDGSHLWKHAFAQGEGPGWMIAVTDQALLIGSPAQSGGTALSALALTDGHLLWRSPTNLLSSYSAGGTNLAIAPPYLFSVFDRDVIAIRLSDGAQVWHTHLDHENLSVFDQLIAQDGIVVVQLSPAPCSFSCSESVPRIIALDGATGKVYWRQDAPGAQLVVGPMPSESTSATG